MAQNEAAPMHTGEQLQSNGITKHQEALMNYAITATTQANRIQTEELVERARVIVKSEIHANFEAYSKMTTSRRVLMGVGAILAFGAGFLVKGALVNRQEAPTNHVND